MNVKPTVSLETHGQDPLILVIFALTESSVFFASSQRQKKKTAITMFRQQVKCITGISLSPRQDLKQK